MGEWTFHSYSKIELRPGERIVSSVFDARSGNILVFTDVGSVYVVVYSG